MENVVLRSRAEIWLEDINLRLGTGLSVLIGPTLAGKTTLMRVIAGLARPSSGTVTVNGADVTNVPVRDRSVAFVYQQFINYPSLSVYDNIAAPLTVKRGAAKPEIDRRVREVADLMELTPFLQRRPSELSGGQQQRTAIARALARKADVVLLDEPLANLDYKLRESLRLELQQIFADSQMIVLYSTADPAEALSFATKTVVLDQGRVAQVDDAFSIYSNPRNTAVARTLSDPPINLLPADVRDDTLHLAGVTVPAPREVQPFSGRALTLGIRAHRLTLRPRDVDGIALSGTIRVAEMSGSLTFVHVILPGDHHVVVELDGTQEFTPGDPVRLYVDPAAFHVFDADSGQLLDTAREEAGAHG